MEKIMINSEELLIETCLISKADKYGKITYANDKFCKISGYTLKELLGEDHKIVNSGNHNKDFWKGMYQTVKNEKKIWYDIVTNKNKKGELYYVKSWIKGIFNEDEFLGYISVRQDVTDIINAKNEIDKKNTYLEHAAKILRHDMHSGINTYIPRGISSLERRLKPEVIEQYKLEIPIKMLKEGLTHTQKVYKGVFEFTNLVKYNSKIELQPHNLKNILNDYLSSTVYKDQVLIEDLGVMNVNESLFCTAIDNLIRNGLKYNDSATKYVKVYRENDTLFVKDNGRGMSQEDFNYLSKPYVRKEGQKEKGTGLGLNICTAILNEHKFEILCNKWCDFNNSGTIITIINKQSI
jgi:PAS domain S-box-containing protein